MLNLLKFSLLNFGQKRQNRPLYVLIKHYKNCPAATGRFLQYMLVRVAPIFYNRSVSIILLLHPFCDPDLHPFCYHTRVSLLVLTYEKNENFDHLAMNHSSIVLDALIKYQTHIKTARNCTLSTPEAPFAVFLFKSEFVRGRKWFCKSFAVLTVNNIYTPNMKRQIKE